MFFDGGSRGNGTGRAVAGSGAVIFRYSSFAPVSKDTIPQRFRPGTQFPAFYSAPPSVFLPRPSFAFVVDGCAWKDGLTVRRRRRRSGTQVWSAGRFLGQVTNNVAEYDGLILGLEGAAKLGAAKLSVYNQVNAAQNCRNVGVRFCLGRVRDVATRVIFVFEKSARERNEG